MCMKQVNKFGLWFGFAEARLCGYTQGLQECNKKHDLHTCSALRNRLIAGRVLRVGALLSVLVFTMGCAGGWPVRASDGQWLSKPTGEGLVADAKSPIPDLPMPHGFVALAAESSRRVSPDGLRTVVHSYQGRGSLADAITFYRQQVKRAGWKLTGERTSGGVTMIGGLKGSESLTVQVSKPRVVNIIVNIKPIANATQR